MSKTAPDPRTPLFRNRALVGLAIFFAAALSLYALVKTNETQPVSVALADDVPTAGGKTFSPDQKKALGEIIKDYLLKNPEVLIEVQGALEAKLEQQQEEKLKQFVAEHAKDIYRSATSPVAGNAAGDITVVEFFDYNCGYCKRGLPEIKKLIEADSKVRVVFKEFPILSQGSIEAAKAALAADKQGKYWEFHREMLNHRGQANAASSKKVAEKIGLDMAKFETDLKSDAVSSEIASVKSLAAQLGVNGTPHFLVGNTSIPGAPEDLSDRLAKLVTKFRNDGCNYC